MTNEAHKDGSPREAQTSLCLVTPYAPSVSETFIRAHVEGLPAKVFLIHGWRPMIADKPVLSWPERALHKGRRWLSGQGLEAETTAAYLKAIRRSRARAVLAEYGPTGVQAMEACRRAKVPLIVYFHGYDATQRDVLAEHAETYPRLFKRAAALVAVSRPMQQRLIALGAPPEKVHYNPCGADCQSVSAFARVRSACPEARLRMIGDGPLLEPSRSLAQELGIEKAVTFLGAQPHAVVQEEMLRARCFVQHSVEAPNGDCEGTPVGILEAGAMGLPVVSTRHAGIPDVVVEERTGLLVDERDVEGMARQMLRLAEDAELAGQLGREARRHIEQHFSQEQSLKRLWTIIESTFDNCAPPREPAAIAAA
jgi:colanic acid/amylovoran biosynthesis glycosyltransferase